MILDFWVVRRIVGGSYVESKDGVWYRIVKVGPDGQERVQTPYGLMPTNLDYFIRRQDM